MRWIFWAAVAAVSYTYLGYAACLYVRSRWRPRPVRSGPFFPSVSIVVVVRNEERVLERKLRNLTQLNYPHDKREIVVVSDGSSDGTNSILAAFSRTVGVRAILNEQPRGKASALNDATKIACGEIVVFTDARQEIDPNAVQLLMENFADSSVGCASGQLILGAPASGEAAEGMGLYWKLEKKIREMEASSGSQVGATGALYAVRRSLIVPIPQETILDDVYIPMHALRQGARIVFDPRAQAWDVPDQGMKREFARKVRTLTGNYQLVRLAPWLLGSSNPIWFEFVSHKLLRLLVPFALGAALLTSALLRDPIYRIALILQFAFYGLGIWALVRSRRRSLDRISSAASTFLLLNSAAVVAFANFIAGRQPAWRP